MNSKNRTIAEQVIFANKKYREGNPVISDQEYDALLDTLKRIDPNSEIFISGVINPDEPEDRKEKLPYPMYSLDKLKTIEEIMDWIKKYNLFDEYLVITGKYDGISLQVNENKEKCWTRGDGLEGQRSHEHFKLTKEKSSFTVENDYTFGEAVILPHTFRKYSSKYANSRNMIGGLFGTDDASLAIALPDVSYMRYGIHNSKENKLEQLEVLNNLNNEIVLSSIIRGCIGIEDMKDVETKLNNLYERWSKDYPIDGLVIEVNRYTIREKLGKETNNNPAYARAIKFPEWNEVGEALVNNIKWEVSKDGKLKPVIQIEPIELSGVTISNVTGYNVKYIFDNNITTGSVIEIVRSGEVIPKHIKTISYSTFQVDMMAQDLNYCPCCNEIVQWDETNTELLCINPECKEMLINKLVHFFNALEIEDFGKPTIEKLYEAGHKDIYSILSISYDNFMKIKGLGQEMFKKTISQFSKLYLEGISLAKFLYALNVFNGKIGKKTCQKIFDNYDFNTFLGDSEIDKENILVGIDGIEITTARVFIKGIIAYQTIRDRLHALVLVSRISTPKAAGDHYKGFKVCFSGFRDPGLELDIPNEGGEIISGVSKNTTHLLVKDPSAATSKIKKALTLGIKVMTKEEFLKI